MSVNTDAGRWARGNENFRAHYEVCPLHSLEVCYLGRKMAGIRTIVEHMNDDHGCSFSYIALWLDTLPFKVYM